MTVTSIMPYSAIHISVTRPADEYRFGRDVAL
jgi:hypothetical protein